jgi:hypothetical protein
MPIYPRSADPKSHLANSPSLITYGDGAALFRCPPPETIMPSSRSSSLTDPRENGFALEVPEDVPNRQGNWCALGLGLPTVGLAVDSEKDGQATDLKRSHPELSGLFDTHHLPHTFIPSTPISGLPCSSVSGWPSPFRTWNSHSLAPIASEAPLLSTFGQAHSSAPSVTTSIPDPTSLSPPAPSSVASRWLELYHDSQHSRSRAQLSRVAGLGLGLVTTMPSESSQLLPSQGFDPSQRKRQASFPKSQPISGLPHSSISQWPLSPDLPSLEACQTAGSDSTGWYGPGSCSSSPRWSMCPQSSPSEFSEMVDTSCALPSYK